MNVSNVSTLLPELTSFVKLQNLTVAEAESGRRASFNAL